MNKPQMTLGQALIVDWKRELRIGNPKRIMKLIYPTTVMYILVHFIIAPFVRAYYRLLGWAIPVLNYIGGRIGFHIELREAEIKNHTEYRGR